eukprot:scaffold10431_cov146-Isochrysis_galbana.AAC.1
MDISAVAVMSERRAAATVLRAAHRPRILRQESRRLPPPQSLSLQRTDCLRRHHHLPCLPIFPSYVSSAAAACNTRCTDAAEAAKHLKYDQIATTAGVLFSVAAFTTYGGWGSEFRNKYVEPLSPSTSPSSKKPKPRAAT